METCKTYWEINENMPSTKRAFHVLTQPSGMCVIIRVDPSKTKPTDIKTAINTELADMGDPVTP